MDKKKSGVMHITNRDLFKMMKEVRDKLNDIHTAQAVTNGTVKLHTKFLAALSGAIVVIVGWFIK